ncbi:MAG TPA: hypothetical protein VFD46_02320, partial [Chryseolinea sp.]|nr:hypothetical protein [Chryseolinea sp.]
MISTISGLKSVSVFSGKITVVMICLLLAATSNDANAQTRPNFIVIFTDDQGMAIWGVTVIRRSRHPI